jgi:RNA polymerase sigma-70 factor, ECF subfamily
LIGDPTKSFFRISCHNNSEQATMMFLKPGPVVPMEETEYLDTELSLAETGSQWTGCLQRIAEQQDRLAFRQLYDHFGPLIKAYAFKVPGLEQTEVFAEELVQETMLKVWTKAGSFDVRLASAGTWIFTIARNMRIDLLRKSARHVVNTVSLNNDEDDNTLELEDIWFEDENSDVFAAVAQQRSAKLIKESLQTLPNDQAEILRKVYLEDKSHTEVAEELHLPLGTVKSRVRLALNKLKLLMDS